MIISILSLFWFALRVSILDGKKVEPRYYDKFLSFIRCISLHSRLVRLLFSLFRSAPPDLIRWLLGSHDKEEDRGKRGEKIYRGDTFLQTPKHRRNPKFLPFTKDKVILKVHSFWQRHFERSFHFDIARRSRRKKTIYSFKWVARRLFDERTVSSEPASAPPPPHGTLTGNNGTVEVPAPMYLGSHPEHLAPCLVPASDSKNPEERSMPREPKIPNFTHISPKKKRIYFYIVNIFI